MVLSAPTILQSWVRNPSTPSTYAPLIWIVEIDIVINIGMKMRTKVNKKEAGIGPWFKKDYERNDRETLYLVL